MIRDEKKHQDCGCPRQKCFGKDFVQVDACAIAGIVHHGRVKPLLPNALCNSVPPWGWHLTVGGRGRSAATGQDAHQRHDITMRQPVPGPPSAGLCWRAVAAAAQHRVGEAAVRGVAGCRRCGVGPVATRARTRSEAPVKAALHAVFAISPKHDSLKTRRPQNYCQIAVRVWKCL